MDKIIGISKYPKRCTDTEYAAANQKRLIDAIHHTGEEKTNQNRDDRHHRKVVAGSAYILFDCKLRDKCNHT